MVLAQLLFKDGYQWDGSEPRFRFRVGNDGLITVIAYSLTYVDAVIDVVHVTVDIDGQCFAPAKTGIKHDHNGGMKPMVRVIEDQLALLLRDGTVRALCSPRRLRVL